MVAPRNADVCRRSFLALYRSGVFVRIMNFVFLCCAVAAIHLSVSGQSNVSGRFFGVVRDRATHAVIPDATATFKNLRTGSLTTARSGSDGQFSYTPLPPDDYEIEVKADGYLPQMQRQILTAMQPTPVEPIPFELIKETIAANATPIPPTTDNTNLQPTPTPAPPRTETESISLNPSRGAVFDIRAVLGLPLGGTTLTRSFDELAFLVPGVYLPPQAIGNTVGPGIGGGVGTSGQFSVNGLALAGEQLHRRRLRQQRRGHRRPPSGFFYTRTAADRIHSGIPDRHPSAPSTGETWGRRSTPFRKAAATISRHYLRLGQR